MDKFADKSETLTILKVEAPDLSQEHPRLPKKKYRVRLELNRYPHPGEIYAIERNRFSLKAKVQQWFIIVDNTNLERIEEIAISLNKYVQSSSQKVLLARSEKLAREARVDGTKQDREARLREKARGIKFR
ncbi:hypothetical protein [Brevibacterium aurantiacum]|uniref:Uncharacterized protein n=1 Tax=Brevibacterium aurantiacum TaxID=273384 RepID=A0A2A3YSU9_BREAU|nr:hypothetical protein [Brevibacterium aurantiacum]PCC42319.1 hypothetical protein CIK65_12910 [Brevibacterium aurantiacum]